MLQIKRGQSPPPSQYNGQMNILRKTSRVQVFNYKLFIGLPLGCYAWVLQSTDRLLISIFGFYLLNFYQSLCFFNYVLSLSYRSLFFRNISKSSILSNGGQGIRKKNGSKKTGVEETQMGQEKGRKGEVDRERTIIIVHGHQKIREWRF